MPLGDRFLEFTEEEAEEWRTPRRVAGEIIDRPRQHPNPAGWPRDHPAPDPRPAPPRRLTPEDEFFARQIARGFAGMLFIVVVTSIAMGILDYQSKKTQMTSQVV